MVGIELYVIVPKAVQSRVISCMRKDGYVMKQAVSYGGKGKEMYMSKFDVLWSVKSLISVDRWYYGECDQEMRMPKLAQTCLQRKE